MDEIIAGALVIGTLVGSILLGVFLCLLPPRLFLRDAPWLTEEEFLATVPEKAWCRHTPAIAILVGFPTYLLLFLGVQFTCNNTLPFLVAMVPLYFMWIYVVVGVVEVISGVSVLVPVGRARGLKAAYVAGPRAVRAGIFRLACTAVVLAALLVAAYW
jgi:hypothetical protein